jgi:hypothetical protein
MSGRNVRFPAEYVLKWGICDYPYVNSGNMSRKNVRFPGKIRTEMEKFVTIRT